MDAFDAYGAFWQADGSDADSVSGRLSFDPCEGVELVLFGPLRTDSRSLLDPPVGDGPILLHGWLLGTPVTLIDCYSKGDRRGPVGVREATFMVNSILRGGHFLESQLRFNSVHMRTSGGADWIGRRIASLDEGGRSQESMGWLNYARPDEQVAKFSDGELSVWYSYNAAGGGSVEQVSFEHWPVFSIQCAELTDFDKLRSYLGRIEDLITMCADQVTVPKRLAVARSDLLVRAVSGDELDMEQEFEYLAPRLECKTWKRRHPYRMLATFDELGGVHAMTRWLDGTRKFGRSLDSMMSVKRGGRMYTENRFLNVAFAAEAYHRDVYGGASMPDAEFQELRSRCLAAAGEENRVWLDQRLRYANEVTLKNRVRYLFDLCGAEALGFVEHPKRWVNVIAGVRNALTHLDSARSGFEGADLFYLSESLYSLVRACMLMEIGVSSDHISERSSTDAFSWYGPKVNEVVDRLRRKI